MQDKNKTGTALIALDSGIRVTVTPAAATVSTGAIFQFTATLTTDNDPQ